MKKRDTIYARDDNFLSDLCGREEFVDDVQSYHNFLSDLCGREGLAYG